MRRPRPLFCVRPEGPRRSADGDLTQARPRGAPCCPPGASPAWRGAPRQRGARAQLPAGYPALNLRLHLEWHGCRDGSWRGSDGMIEHVSLRCSDASESRRFYERALEPLGYVCDKEYGDSFGFKDDE